MNNMDKGIKVVASHIDPTEYKGPTIGYIRCLSPHLVANLWLALGNGKIVRLAESGKIETLTTLSGVPIAAIGDIDGLSVLIRMR